MADLWTRLKQRKLVQWALAYVAFSFALLQGIDIVAQQFAWPASVQRATTLALVLGFFVTLLLAWYHGERGVQKVTGTELLLLALLLAIGGGLMWRFAGSTAGADARGMARSGSAAAPSSVESAIPAKSIAVLAFTDLSPHHDKGYFSDGIAEELLNALARVQGLKVAGRTSAFRFKGKDADPRTIGVTLGVANVLEGSVRTQGDKVRITAQLVRTRDGFQLWSHAYDGDLKDIFALQETIARRITDQLKVTLSGRQARRLVDVGTRNPQAYALYLQATATFNRRDGAHFDEAMAQLRQAIALDPQFAQAWSRMSTLKAVWAQYTGVGFTAAMHEAERDARKASALDPRLAEPHAVLSVISVGQRRYREGREEMARALALNPNDVTTNFWNGVNLDMTGYRRQAAEALDHVLKIDPLLPNALMWRASMHAMDGQFDIAQRQLQRADEAGLSFVGLGQYRLDQARGDRAAAARSLTRGLSYFARGFPPGTAAVFARACTGDAGAKTQARRLIDSYLATRPEVLSAVVPYVLVCMGDAERGLALAAAAPTNNDAMLMSNLFGGIRPAVLRTKAFGRFVRKIGLAAYWDAFGAPDMCRKGSDGDYTCSLPDTPAPAASSSQVPS